MSNPIEILKDNGIRVTPQRVAVFQLFCKESTGHISAEEVYAGVRKKFPAISLATVYSIIEALRNKGLLREVGIRADKTLFESRPDNHHHFLCSQCGAVFDLDFEPCDGFKHMRIGGHKVEKVQGYFYGICKDCIDSETR